MYPNANPMVGASEPYMLPLAEQLLPPGVRIPQYMGAHSMDSSSGGGSGSTAGMDSMGTLGKRRGASRLSRGDLMEHGDSDALDAYSGSRLDDALSRTHLADGGAEEGGGVMRGQKARRMGGGAGAGGDPSGYGTLHPPHMTGHYGGSLEGPAVAGAWRGGPLPPDLLAGVDMLLRASGEREPPTLAELGSLQVVPERRESNSSHHSTGGNPSVPGNPAAYPPGSAGRGRERTGGGSAPSLPLLTTRALIPEHPPDIGITADSDLDAIMPYPAWAITFGASSGSSAPSGPEHIVANAAGAKLFNVALEDVPSLQWCETMLWLHPEEILQRAMVAQQVRQTGGAYYEWSGTYVKRIVSLVPPLLSLPPPAPWPTGTADLGFATGVGSDGRSGESAASLQPEPWQGSGDRGYSSDVGMEGGAPVVPPPPPPPTVKVRYATFTAVERIFMGYSKSGAIRRVLSIFTQMQDTGADLPASVVDAMLAQGGGGGPKKTPVSRAPRSFSSAPPTGPWPAATAGSRASPTPPTAQLLVNPQSGTVMPYFSTTSLEASASPLMPGGSMGKPGGGRVSFSAFSGLITERPSHDIPWNYRGPWSV